MIEELLVKELGVLRFELLKYQASYSELEKEVQMLREFKNFVESNPELNDLVKEARNEYGNK